MTTYGIKIETTNPLTESFVKAGEGFWETTTWLDEAKTWKTEAGAKRWMERYPEAKERMQVVTFRVGKKSGKPAGLVAGGA